MGKGRPSKAILQPGPTNQLVAAMAHEGYTQAEVADELGVSVETLGVFTRRIGFEWPQRNPVDHELREAVVRALELGCKTATSVARLLGRKPDTVQKFMRRMRDEGTVRMIGVRRWARWELVGWTEQALRKEHNGTHRQNGTG